MTRPDWCPEDVWAVAERVFTPPDFLHVPAIARAILAEREACASVAEGCAGTIRLGGINAWHGATDIARAIRTRSAP